MKPVEFEKRFDSEESCEVFLRRQREKEGIICPKCGCKDYYWDKCNNRWKCKKCGHVITLSAGTVISGSKLPLLYWFKTINLLLENGNTLPVLEVKRQLHHKRYEPIWRMVRILKNVMQTQDERYQLIKAIEMGDDYFAAEEATGTDGSPKKEPESQCESEQEKH